ncbi:MAG: putative domain containing protein [Pedosphaera sp.]|nr:putative domain containing protein [Pedosphaera sp.]
MKTKWFRILLAIAVVAMVGTIAWQVRRASGPFYEGESLAVWARRLPGGQDNFNGISWSPLLFDGSHQESKAEQAIRQMGTNALPALMRRMRTGDSARGVTFDKVMRWARSRVSGQSVDFTIEMSPAERRRWEAALALHALGPLAKPAVPELAALLTNRVCSRDAAYALASMGPEGFVPLRQAMTNRWDWIQMCAVWALGQTPTDGKFAVSALLGCLQDKSPGVRSAAAWSLGRIHADPELVAPALATKLGDTGPGVRAITEGALKEYGITSVTNSALVRYLDDPKLHVRMAATNALKAIDPEAAVKAGVR